MSFKSQLDRRGLAFEGVDVDTVDDLVDDRLGGERRVLDRVAAAGAQRPVGHPAQVGRESRPSSGRSWGWEIRSPRETSTSSLRRIVTDIGGNASSNGPSVRLDRFDRRLHAARQHDDRVAGPHRRARDLARIAAVVVMRIPAARITHMHREAQVVEVAVATDLDRLEMLEQRQSAIPRHPLGAVDDVVAILGRERDERDVADPVQPLAKRAEVAHDRVEDLLVESRRGPSC